MSETKKPEAGEWWRTDYGEILLFVGWTSDGSQVWQDEDLEFTVANDVDRGWNHLPGCDGFTCPKDDRICPDCGEPAGDGHEDVCPEAWVEHVGNVPRPSIDQWRWWSKDAVDREWTETMSFAMVHGGYEATENTLQVRCRRKDLPMAAATEQPKRREMTEVERKCPDVPQGFVEITDGDHVLRKDIDWIWFPRSHNWEEVDGIADCTISNCDPCRFCCHVSDAPQSAVTDSDGELDQFLPSTQQAFDDLHRRCSDLSGQVDRLKREIQTVVDGVEAAQDRYDRSLPVTVEWLKSIGFESRPNASLQLRVTPLISLVYWLVLESWSIRESGASVRIAESIPNRGRVIDLLSGLGVEIKVATSNLSATSSCGKWAMDQA